MLHIKKNNSLERKHFVCLKYLVIWARERGIPLDLNPQIWIPKFWISDPDNLCTYVKSCHISAIYTSPSIMYSRLCVTRDTSQNMSLGKMAHPTLWSTLILVATGTEKISSVALNTHFSWICRLSEALSGWPTATSQGWHYTESLLTSFRAFSLHPLCLSRNRCCAVNVSCISEEGYRRQRESILYQGLETAALRGEGTKH